MSVGLSDADGILALGQERWGGMDLAARHKLLMRLADSLLVKHMVDDGQVSKQWAATRLQQITARGA